MEATFQRGVYLPELDLWLDSLRKREFGLISHAHSDHTARHSRPVLTGNTRLLLSDYLKRSDPITLDYGEPLDRGGYTLALYPAGHCLGSAQALITSKLTGERLLYTGDFKSRPSPINEPLEPVECDTLVIEATYGKPEYVFPAEEKVLETAFNTLRMWLSKGERPVVQGWRLGKAQEIMHHLLSQGFELVVEESIFQIAEVYQEAGVKFPGEFSCLDGHWAEGQVLVCPPGFWKAREMNLAFGKRYMELTGWASGKGGRRWGRRGDASLAYSDHADFNDLVEYVKRVRPKQVYTVNGFPDLAAHLRTLGYPAVHLDGKNGQQDNGGFQMKLV
jgi:Cft2 family RNA processing exonuclease